MILPWLGDALRAYKFILANGVSVPTRQTVNLGPGFTVTDNPNAQRTDVGVVSSVWKTIFDVDLTAQPTTNLTANGNYTIGGVTMSRQNAAHDRVAMVLTNGTGVQVAPDHTCNYDGSTRTMPLLFIPFSQFTIPGLDWFTKWRLYVDVTDNGAQDLSFPTFGIDTNSLAWSLQVIRGRNTSHDQLIWASILGSTDDTSAELQITKSSSNEVVIVQTRDPFRPEVDVMLGAGGGAWPTPASAAPALSTKSLDLGSGPANLTGTAPGPLGVFFGCSANGNTDPVVATYKRIRLDALTQT